jgi:hypothetical protein
MNMSDFFPCSEDAYDRIMNEAPDNGAEDALPELDSLELLEIAEDLDMLDEVEVYDSLEDLPQFEAMHRSSPRSSDWN